MPKKVILQNLRFQFIKRNECYDHNVLKIVSSWLGKFFYSPSYDLLGKGESMFLGTEYGLSSDPLLSSH